MAVAGLRTRQITLNAETVDVTNADSTGRWRELLAGAGVRSAALSGSGVFKDEATSERLRALFFAGAIPAVMAAARDDERAGEYSEDPGGEGGHP